MTRALRCDDFDTPHGYIPTKNISNPNLALLGPLGAQKRAETRPKCVVTMSLTLAEQPVAVRTKFGPRGPPALGPRGPQKEHFGPKLALLGPQGAQKRADTRPKCVVTMCPIALDQSAAVGTKSGSGGPKKAFWGPNEPFFGAPGVP